jgi:hypothetical protein
MKSYNFLSKPQINMNFLPHIAQETGNNPKILGSHSVVAEDSSLLGMPHCVN